MRDSVLSREMFKKPEDTESDGITSLVKSSSDYEERKRRAEELLASAKERQNPENFKSLADQSRPGVFRPVATGQPQAPQQNTQQQLAQMQAMGFRPVGMADGGYVQRFSDGSGPFGVVDPMAIPRLTPTIDTVPSADGRVERLNLPTETPDVSSVPSTGREKLYQTEFPGLKDLSNEEIDRLAQEEYERLKEERIQGRAKTPFGRGIQSLAEKIPGVGSISSEPSLKDIKESLTERRDNARVREAVKETPVPGPFDTATTAEVTAAEKAREEATAKARGEVSESEREAQRARALGNLTLRPTAPAENPPETPAPTASKDTGDQTVEDKLNLRLEAIKKQREADKNTDFNMALLQAGLAMMGGESPNALKNIAAGGISGLQAYSELQKGRRTADIADRELAAKEQYYNIMQAKLDQAEEQRKARLVQSISAAKQKGAIEAEKAYAKWLDTQEGSMASPESKVAYRRKLEDQFTRVFFNDYTLGSGSSSSDPASLFGE